LEERSSKEGHGGDLGDPQVAAGIEEGGALRSKEEISREARTRGRSSS
jgi:hypothetical protein